MSDAPEACVARMMTWRSRVIIPTILLLGLGILGVPFRLSQGLSTVLGLIELALLLWAVPFWLILIGAIFRTGQIAFGFPAGFAYAALALVLTFFFGIGVFVVPLMLRADVRRLLGIARENS